MPQATPTHAPQPQRDPFAGDDGQTAPLPQVLKKLEIITKRRVENLFAGAYQAIFQGQGMVFADVRPYQPGDEVRWIDWNVSARMNELYIKQFTEERERTVMLLWDASPSMDLGHRHRSKRELCAELAMLLAMSAIHNGDRVGLILFADKVERYIPPQRGRKHVMRMVQEILQCQPSPQATHSTAMAEALRFLHRVAPRHTISFVMSDFLVPFEHSDEGLWQRLAAKCDMLPIMLSDPLERQLPQTQTTQENGKEDASDAGEHAENPTASPIDNPLVTVLFGVFCLVFGLWLGGLWQWMGAAALGLCCLVGWSLRDPRSGAIYQLQDLETRQPFAIDATDAATQTQLEGQSTLHREEWEQRFKRLQIEAISLPTEEDYLTILLRYFRMRQRRSR